MNGRSSDVDVTPGSENDLDDVVALIEAADEALGVPPDPIRGELSWIWHLPTTRLDRDTRIVRDRGELVAYAEATWKVPESGEPLDVRVCVLPGRAPAGIEASLLDWAEGEAERRGSPGIRAWVVDRDESLATVLRSRGFVHVRSAFTMWRTLTDEGESLDPPDGVTIRPFSEADERTLYELHQAAFAEHFGFHPISFERWVELLHADGWDPSLVFLADADGSPAGYVVGLLEETTGLVAIIGVLKEHRGRGIAKALLHRSFDEFARRGRHAVRLTVDTENTAGAVRVYEAVGMTARRRYDAFDRGTPEAESVGRTSA
jgi:ribosomal protein S18 acetylase RimI-like enzyme